MSKYPYLALLLLATYSVQAETNWEKYLSYPAPENATGVTEIEYSPGSIESNHGYWAPDLEVLRNQILGRDQASFHLAVRLLDSTDGGLLEEVISVLADSIRPNPQMFLSEIRKSEISDYFLKSVLQYPGLEYTDRLSAKEYEIEQRKIALSSVEDPNLQSIKEKCLELIKN